MNIQKVIAAISIVLISNAWAAGENSNARVSLDKFYMSAYWTALGYLEKGVDISINSDWLDVRFKAFCASVEAGDLIFQQDQKWIDSTTFRKRVNKIVNSYKPENSTCRLPTSKELLVKMLTEPRPLTDINDLVVDSASMRGKAVMVNGNGMFAMNQFVLMRSTMDMNPVYVDINKLNIDKRKEILKRCGDIAAMCKVTILGKASNDSPPPRIIADDVFW